MADCQSESAGHATHFALPLIVSLVGMSSMDRVGEAGGPQPAGSARSLVGRGGGHQSVEYLMPELIRGLAQNHIGDTVPGQSRGILDLLEEDQSRDKRLREHRLRWSQTREVVQSPSSQTDGSSSVSQYLQELLNQELNRQIQNHLNQEIQRQIQDQLQMYVEQEMERQILQQMMNVDFLMGDS